MIRATVIRAIEAFLNDSENYDGPVSILTEANEGEMAPPYAVVRIGSGEQMFAEAQVWDLSIMIGVFHDADTTTAATAESQAAALFAALDDPDPLFEASEETLVWSAMDRTGTEASIVETRWQHVAVWRGIVAPVADED